MSQRLDEISLLRPITIGILIVMHAFTMYAGNWPLPDGIEPVRAYFWVQKISFSCMLEMFVFISGYIFGYQLFGQKREFRFGELVTGKLRRLILPSILFSLLYIVCFTDWFGQHQWKMIAYNTLAGQAHMWFLPMLFWCFIGGWVIVKCRINDVLALVLLLVVSIFSHLPLPFQVNMACYYLFFFYLGMFLYKHREKMTEFAKKQPAGLYVSLAVYLLLVVLQTRTIESLSVITCEPLATRLLLFAQINTCKISYALTGVVLLYLLALRYVSHAMLSNFTLDLNKYCFAIYLFQQFILELIYYYTPLPLYVGTYWLPWIGIATASIGSYALARLLLMTRSGKYLLG